MFILAGSLYPEFLIQASVRIYSVASVLLISLIRVFMKTDKLEAIVPKLLSLL